MTGVQTCALPISAEAFPIAIDDAQGCARYTARIVRNVKIGPSPQPVARRLELLGSRPINNAADATNYALNELGHPTHVFDLERCARYNERNLGRLRSRWGKRQYQA